MFLRLATGVVVSAIAALLIWQGVEALRFTSLLDASETLINRADARKGPAAKDLARIDAQLAPWRDRPGFATTARELAFDLQDRWNRDDNARAEELVSLLKARPTAGLGWYELAQWRWGQGAPFSSVLSALELSNISEPREQATMTRRLPLQLRLWELLPPELQRATINQLVELDGRMERQALAGLKEIIEAKPEATREELKSRLIMRGAQRRPWGKSIGL